MSLCQFFHDGPGVGSTELCPLERPQYQALAMQTRWKPLPWSRSSAPLFKVLLLPCRQGENHPHGVFFLLFNPRSSRKLSWAVCLPFSSNALADRWRSRCTNNARRGKLGAGWTVCLVSVVITIFAIITIDERDHLSLIKMSWCLLNWYPAQH